MKIAFMFSGQGAQYPGMGKELYEQYQVVRDIFQEANDALGFSISEICFEENETLNQTEFTQPAILTMSFACYRLMLEYQVKPDYCLGLSLGEYSALVASGALAFSDAVPLVRKRGRFMTEAVPEGKGCMYAILGLNREGVEESCRDAFCEGMVLPANYNAPEQIVIAGETKACEKAAHVALEKGAKKAVRLNVSGPFHTALLKPASEQLGEELKTLRIDELKIPVVANLTGNILASSEDVFSNLTSQIMCPVMWEESMNCAIALGVDTFIELGPGKTLCAFAKKIKKDLRIFNVEDVKSLEKTLQGLQA